MEPEPGTQRTAKIPVKIWFFAHVILITLWTLPQPPRDENGMMRQDTGLNKFLYWTDAKVRNSGPQRMYVSSTGLWQYWDMFAPDPLNTDYYVTADIQFLDGTQKNFEYPRIATMNLAQKFVNERFRKFIERAHSDEYLYLWPTTAQWIAGQHFTDPKNPPVAVRLNYHSRRIPPPTPKMPEPWSYEIQPYFDHVVDQSKLFKDKGLTIPEGQF